MTGTKPWPEVPVTNVDFTNTSVLIIGSGISGICASIDLLNRGIKNFLIVEKSAGVGGTWRDNKYPGCACDVWSLLYSYSFEQKPDWTRLYPGQEEILDYLIETAAKHGLYKYVRFNTVVESASWNELNSKWDTRVSVAGGKEAEFQKEYTITSDFLVSAVGQLNQPKFPDLDGLQDYAGRIMHSARWDWGYNLNEKKVAIIGNGATAVQIIPELSKVASELTVFQRTPNWVIYRIDQPVSPLMRSALSWFPPLRWRTRAGMMDFREDFFDAVADPDGSMAQIIRDQCVQGIEDNFPGKENEEIRKSLMPRHAPLCKRVCISDDYYAALAKPSVNLETRPIERVTSSGICVQDASGRLIEHQVDLIVCATGFRTVQFLYPIKITGRNGRALDEIWSGGARALYGILVEDLPNFMCLYGVNSNLGHNSIILMIEQQTRYINTLIEKVLRLRSQQEFPVSLTPKTARLEEYNKDLQGKLGRSAFADPKCNSWYKDPRTGLITNNWSGNVVEYQKLLSAVDWSDFDGGELVAAKEDGTLVTHIGRVREESYISDALLGKLTAGSVVLAAAALAWRWYAIRLRLS